MIAIVAWLSIPLAVCAWTWLEGCRRRNPITRLGRLLHIACLLTQIGWYHFRHHAKAAWYLATDFAWWAWLYFGGTLQRAAQPVPDPPGLTGALRSHPAGRSLARSAQPLNGPFAAWETEHQAWRRQESGRHA
jgi:hypothetical protein